MSFDPVSRADLADLMRRKGPNKVSIYLPTFRSGPDTRENPVRLKNLLRQAEEGLVATGMRPTLARDMLRPGHEIEEVQEFQADLGDGLALFFDEAGMRKYRLPSAVPELCVVADRFDVKHLLRLVLDQAGYYLLALSMNETRAFRGHRLDIHELRIDDMPRSIGDALWADDPERQQQFRSASSGSSARGAVFYGSGDSKSDRLKDDVASYLNLVDRAFVKAVEGDGSPLVLAAVGYLQPIYRSVSEYEPVLGEGVEGNPEQARPEELAHQAWPLVERFYEAARRAEADRFGNLTGTGKASTELPEIVAAAIKGRVDTLWVAAGEQRWGRLADGKVVEHASQEPGDDDLLDIAAAEALANGGTVHVEDVERIPGGAQAAAILRY
jgi:hypothetical protein